MNKELFLQLLYVFLYAIILIVLEQIICFFIVKKRGELEIFREYKEKHKNLFQYSSYLYKDKKYLYSIKFVLIGFTALTILLSNSTSNQLYYDARGNSYKKSIDILFYDEKGNSYSVDKDTKCFIDSNNNLTEKEFVDINGVVTDLKEDTFFSGISGLSYTSSGSVYFECDNVYWDEENRMHYFNNAQDILVNEYKFFVDTKDGCSFEKIEQ